MTLREDDERPDADTKKRLPLGELRPDDRGQDEVREELEEGIGRGEARPLTREEREAAARDPGPAKTVYAPASERKASGLPCRRRCWPAREHPTWSFGLPLQRRMPVDWPTSIKWPSGSRM